MRTSILAAGTSILLAAQASAAGEIIIPSVESVSADGAVPYSAFMTLTADGAFASATLVASEGVIAADKDGKTTFTYLPWGADLVSVADRLTAAGVETSFADYSPPAPKDASKQHWRTLAVDFAPLAIFLIFIVYVIWVGAASERRARRTTEEFFDRLDEHLRLRRQG